MLPSANDWGGSRTTRNIKERNKKSSRRRRFSARSEAPLPPSSLFEKRTGLPKLKIFPTIFLISFVGKEGFLLTQTFSRVRRESFPSKPGFPKTQNRLPFWNTLRIPHHFQIWDFRIARLPSQAHSLPWAELNAPLVASIYAHCDIILLKNILLSSCPFESLLPNSEDILKAPKRVLLKYSFVGKEGFEPPVTGPEPVALPLGYFPEDA